LTIEQLMTDTVGLTYGSYTDHAIEAAYREVNLLNSSDLAEFIARLSEIPVRYEPGSRYHYSVATDVLGALVESISAQSPENFFQERIFSPLEMNDTFIDVPNDKLQRSANNHNWNAEDNRMSLPPAEFDRPYTGVNFFRRRRIAVVRDGLHDFLRFVAKRRQLQRCTYSRPEDRSIHDD